ncbi:MAG TPA: hypothetical protein DEP23_12155 [Ruminococcaceae bacterium]|jgi:hypothetical protein|uniref:hypothetical protein n=1 Tax=Novisyntrophococcus fermenticellae TaxID=2068655 RepID=UPI000EEA2BBD|nr:hypothetical protein [Novisyntrophococcus fermenticellae]HCA30254.1 hypothetical protein [Oscillospiraceae bacterium]
MKPKRISVRFNLENDVDRKAWEYLQGAEGSKNSAVISAINTFFEPDATPIADVVRQTIKECFQNVAVMQTKTDKKPDTLSEDENNLLDTLDEFLGG